MNYFNILSIYVSAFNLERGMFDWDANSKDCADDDLQDFIDDNKDLSDEDRAAFIKAINWIRAGKEYRFVNVSISY